jgi:hypothetical protein
MALVLVFNIEKEHGQMGIVYAAFAIMYFLWGAPLNAVVAGIATLDRRWRMFFAFCLAFAAAAVFLVFTDPTVCHFRKLRYPHVISSNVHIYYPIVVVIAFASAPVFGCCFRGHDARDRSDARRDEK